MAFLGLLLGSPNVLAQGFSGTALQFPPYILIRQADGSFASKVVVSPSTNVVVPVTALNNNVQSEVPLLNFATSADIAQITGDISQARTAIDQLRATFDQLNYFIARDRERLAQGVALASAVTIVPPNPGDRFSLTFSGADYNGHSAVSGSVAYRVNENVLVFGAYARSEQQNLVKGGVSFSIK